MAMQRPTPRYTGVVRPMAGMPAAAAVTPLRATPPRSAPAQFADPFAQPLVIRRALPSHRRPWKVLLVPPTPGARTRAFTLARWQARAFLGGLVVLLLLAASAVTAVIVALDSPDFMASTVEVASLRERLRTVQDSLALARAVLADEPNPATGASDGSTPVTGVTPANAPPRPLVARILARSPLTGARSRSPLAGMEDLPVVGAIVSSFATARRHPLLHVVRPHLGIDIAAKRGTPVSAPAAGRVTYVGHRFALGLIVEIAHSDGVSTRYVHLRSALVHVGEKVERGATIATVGSSGLTTGPHLHYEVAVNDRQVDPTLFRLPQVGESPPPPIPLSVAGTGAAKQDSALPHR